MSVAERDTEFYTLRELSEMGLGSVNTLRAHIKSGKLASYQLAGGTKVRRSDLNAYLATRHTPAASGEFDEFVNAVVSAAPAFSDEQRVRITAALVGGAS